MIYLRDIGKFLALAPSERALLALSVVGLTVTSRSLRLFGFKRVYAWLERVRVKAEPPSYPLREARRLADVFGRAARRLPYASCLPQSLTLWWLLHRHGIPADIHVGVMKEEGEVKAHAWVEFQEVVLSDGADVRHRFAPFDHALRKR